MSESKIWYVVVEGKAQGPYTETEMKVQIVDKKIGAADLVFRPGLTQWVTLSQCQEFSDSASENPSEGVATHDDLPTMTVTNMDIGAKDPEDASEEKKKKWEDEEEEELKPKSSRFRKLLIGGTGIGLGIALTYAALVAYDQEKGTVEGVSNRKMASIPLPAPAVPAPKAKENPPVNPELQNRPPKSPSVLKVVTLKTTTANPQVVLESDLPGGTRLDLELTARTGAILKYPSFDLKKNTTVAAGHLPTFDFSQDHLPSGDYTLTVIGGELQTSVPFKLGEHNSSFQKRLAAFRHQIAGQRKKEKASINDGFKYVSQTYKALASQYKKVRTHSANSDARKKWTIFLRSWRKNIEKQTSILKNVNEANRNYFVYSDALLKLKDVEMQLNDVARQYNQNVKKGRAVASESDVEQLFIKNLNDLKETVQKIK